MIKMPHRLARRKRTQTSPGRSTVESSSPSRRSSKKCQARLSRLPNRKSQRRRESSLVWLTRRRESEPRRRRSPNPMTMASLSRRKLEPRRRRSSQSSRTRTWSKTQELWTSTPLMEERKERPSRNRELEREIGEPIRMN